MKAMIFAAGLGTRLKPLTNSMPKALIPVNNRPMIEWLILRLIKYDIKNIIINVHHHADQIIDFLRSKNHFNINIEISHELKLLDTGGGLKKAEWFFEGEKDILIHNADAFSDIDIYKFYLEHIKNEADATLCVRKRKTRRYLLFDKKGQLVGWKSKAENRTIWVNKKIDPVDEFSFNGIHIISGKLIHKLKAENIYPIIPEYLRLARSHKINAFNTSAYNWMDLGTIKNIKDINNTFDQKYFENLTI